MKRECFTSLFLFIVAVMGLFGQNFERVTYIELKPDGTYVGTRTVEAALLGWSQQQFTIEGNFIVTYSTLCLVGGNWSNWELAERQPARYSLNDIYDSFIETYSRYPNMGTIYNINNNRVLYIFDIPSGNSRPFWWSTDGRSIFTFRKVYGIKP
jgi:hypothetical protein